MKKWVGYVLLAISLVIAFQGYQNARNDPRTEELSASVACDVDSKCVLKGETAHVVRTDIVRRRYEWRSSVGAIKVTCTRAYWFFGGWSCTPEKGSLKGQV